MLFLEAWTIFIYFRLFIWEVLCTEHFKAHLQFGDSGEMQFQPFLIPELRVKGCFVSFRVLEFVPLLKRPLPLHQQSCLFYNCMAC